LHQTDVKGNILSVDKVSTRKSKLEVVIHHSLNEASTWVTDIPFGAKNAFCDVKNVLVFIIRWSETMGEIHLSAAVVFHEFANDINLLSSGHV
jgi:hypothetical protein